MGRRPGLSINDRNIALGLLEAGMRAADVAGRFGCNERTIYRLQAHFRQTGSAKDRPRSGRPRKKTPHEDRYLVMSSRRNRFMAASKLTEHLRHATGTRITVYTARNRLRAARLHSRRPYKGIQLTGRHRTTHVNWARQHSGWARRQWSRVVFTDESKFNLHGPDGRIRVWRRRGERLDPANSMKYDRYGGGSVMIWGGISYNGKTDLRTVRGNLNVVRYCADIITPLIVPYIANSNADVLQQDNARCHTARHTQNVLAANNINTPDWPTKSPDLSPLEHLWDYLGRKVRGRYEVNNVNDLERALHEEWAQVPRQFIQRLINSMRRRCMAVIQARGGHIRY